MNDSRNYSASAIVTISMTGVMDEKG
jgi:hypothetical protein